MLFGSGIDSQVKRFFEENNSYSSEESLSVEPPLLTPENARQPAPAPRLPIDYVEGGIRVANGKRVIESLAKIAGSNVEDVNVARKMTKDESTFAYLIAMDSISTLTSNVADQIQSWANQFNTMALLGEIAEGQAEGALAKAERLETLRKEQIYDPDRFEARALALASSKEDKEERSIAREALEDLNDETRDLFLAITGSVILHPDGIEFDPPRHKETIQKLLEGSGGERAKTIGMLKEIQIKLQGGSAAFSEEEKQLIHSLRVPLSCLISLMTQYKGSSIALEIERFGHLIAKDRVLQFVEEAAQDALNRGKAYAAVHPLGDAYVSQIERVLDDLQSAKAEQRAQIQAEISALQLMLQFDDALKQGEAGL